jgi:hypothetical protein
MGGAFFKNTTFHEIYRQGLEVHTSVSGPFFLNKSNSINMGHDKEFPGVGSFRDFCRQVAEGIVKNNTYYPGSKEEILAILDAATKVNTWFASRGIKAWQRGQGDVSVKGFEFHAGKSKFVVMPVSKTPAKKGVALTSIDAYHAIDTRKQAGVVAKAAIELTKERGRITDRMVSAYTGLECARVSARRIDSLEPVQGYILDGKAYYFKQMGKAPCPTTGNTVQWWAMLPAEPEQLQIFGG